MTKDIKVLKGFAEQDIRAGHKSCTNEAIYFKVTHIGRYLDGVKNLEGRGSVIIFLRGHLEEYPFDRTVRVLVSDSLEYSWQASGKKLSAAETLGLKKALKKYEKKAVDAIGFVKLLKL